MTQAAEVEGGKARETVGAPDASGPRTSGFVGSAPIPSANQGVRSVSRRAGRLRPEGLTSAAYGTHRAVIQSAPAGAHKGDNGLAPGALSFGGLPGLMMRAPNAFSAYATTCSAILAICITAMVWGTLL